MFTSRTLIFGALAAFATAQSAVLTFTSVPPVITEGQAQTITYSTNDPASPVTITLKKGDANNLQTVTTLTSDSTGGSFSWTPDTSLEAADNYALEITQGSEVNYYGPFSITGQQTTGETDPTPYGSSENTTSPNACANVVTPTPSPVAPDNGGSVPPDHGTHVPGNTTNTTTTLPTPTHTGVVYTGGNATASGIPPVATSTGGASTNVGSAALSVLFGAAAVYFS